MELSDDVLGLILQRLNNSADRRACSRVCSQWRRMEGLTRQKLRIVDAQFLSRFLPRFPNLITLEADIGLSDADLVFVSETCRLLQVVQLNLSKHRMTMDLSLTGDYLDPEMGDEGVCALATSCRDLKHVSLQWRQRVGHIGVAALSRSCCHLSHLDLAHCKGVTDRALEEAISGAACLQVLILRSCTGISDRGISSLVGSCAARSLRCLDLCECDRLTDAGIVLLQQFSSLRSLSLAECGPRITDAGGCALAGIPHLQSLNLSWLVNISDVTMLAISYGCSELRNLKLSGCELVTGVGLHAFINHKSLEVLTLNGCYSVYGDEAEQLATGCPALRYLGLDRTLRGWMRGEVLENVQSHVLVEWL